MPRRVPPVLWVLIAGLLAFGAFRGWDAWRRSLTTFDAVHLAGGTVPELELTFFPDQLAFTTPSPPPPLGTARLPVAAKLTVGQDLVPGRAVVRYAGPGVGAGMVFVESGKPVTIALEQPVALFGRVVERRRFWWLGWRSGLVPVVGAEVIAMGGGEHGVPLGNATTGDDGSFELEGIAAGSGTVALRVLGPTHSILHVAVDRKALEEGGPTIRLEPSPVRRGRLVFPPGLRPEDLLVLARGLPGVQARPDATGGFELRHVPADVEPRLLLVGLPDEFAYTPPPARFGHDTTVEVVRGGTVRGLVVDAVSRHPLAGAHVWCGDGAAIRAGGDGTFELRQVVPGSVEVVAQYTYQPKNRRAIVRRGRTAATLVAGETRTGIVIEVP